MPSRDAQLNTVAGAKPLHLSSPAFNPKPADEANGAGENRLNASKPNETQPSPENTASGGQLARNKRNKIEPGLPAVRSNSPTGNNEFGTREAKVIKPGGHELFGTNWQFELPVRSSAEPIRIRLNDKSGSTRAFSLESVTFGSQDIIQRGGVRPVLTSQKIW